MCGWRLNGLMKHTVHPHQRIQTRCDIDGDAEQSILSFLEWHEPDEERFAQSVRIVLVSANFSKELTTAVMWLNTMDVDIRCVRLKPYSLDGRVLLDVQQVIPLPEAAEYQVQVREKTQRVRNAKNYSRDFTRYDVSIRGETHPSQSKRRAILLIVRSLVQNGVPSDRIASLMPWRPNHVWWFCDDDDLLSISGRTYAFSNEWGKSWTKTMTLLAESFPEHKISFTAVEAND